ncbi:hypothetical protein ACHAW6_013945 [Cyclotella cf. meneghiniana]
MTKRQHPSIQPSIHPTIHSSAMVFPPSPESPAIRFHRTSSNATSSTPRVGMFVSHDDDDDVSVLTFHTLGTKDTVASSSTGHNDNDNHMHKSSADDNQTRNDEAKQCIQKSLSHISEESQNSSSSSHDMYKSSRHDRRFFRRERDADDNDDESLSLAESVLDTANKVLSAIGSSSYYSGWTARSDSLSATKRGPSESSSPRDDDDAGGARREPSSYRDVRNENYDEFDRGGRRRDERCHHNRSPLQEKAAASVGNASRGKDTGTDKLRKIQEETRQLQQLLREKQLETKWAMSELDASIRKASELLK